MPYLFNTPSRRVARSGDRFWARLRENISLSVLKTAGSYRTVEEPTNEEVAAADVAYLGGRTYPVTDTEAAALAAAGYGALLTSTSGTPPETPPRTFGSGLFGSGTFAALGALTIPEQSVTFGGDDFGSGPYGN